MTVIPTYTPSSTASPTSTSTSTVTFIPTQTPTPSTTATATGTSTTTRTQSATSTATSTRTRSRTPTETLTVTTTPTQTARQLIIVGTSPAFASVVNPTWLLPNAATTALALTVVFDHAISFAGTTPNAFLRVYANGTLWQNLTNGNPSISIQGAKLIAHISPPAGARINVTIDADFVKGAETQATPAYFLGTRSRPLHFDTMAFEMVDGIPIAYYPLGYTNTGNFTIALDGDLADFTEEKLCAAIATIIWSTDCSNILFYVYDWLLPVITFRLVNFAAGAPVERCMLDALADGLLSLALRERGLGSIQLGIYVYTRFDQPQLEDINVTLTPHKLSVPTTMTVGFVITTALPAQRKVEITIPEDFYITPSALQVQVTGPNALNQTYRASAGQVGLGATPNAIWVNMTATASAQTLRSGDWLLLTFQQGIQMPDSCANMAKWVWVVRTFDGVDALYDFGLLNPLENTCSSPRVTVGIPDDDPISNSEWISARPTSSFVRESIKVQFVGFRTSSGTGSMTAKIAKSLDGTCAGLAPGSTSSAVDSFGYATFTPTSVGTFDLCILHRTNWESLSVKFVVRRAPPTIIPASGAPPLLGYSTCAALLEVLPSYCGCYYGDGQTGSSSIDVPFSVQIQALLGVSAKQTITQGCCTNPFTSRQAWLVPEKSSLHWGVCLPLAA
eukprot:GGOE01058931.1.p1 GENE.GGOE01058931.1~~GGOE01058931.1.p1  ORF type:complete len:676 (-),score=184.70 GGOE01058931.1:153-2180(-)